MRAGRPMRRRRTALPRDAFRCEILLRWSRPRPQASVTVLRSLRCVDAYRTPAPRWRLALLGGAPARRFVQADRRRDRDVERLLAARLRDAQRGRAAPSSVVGEALPFVAEHPRARPRQGGRVQRACRHANWSPAAARAARRALERRRRSTRSQREVRAHRRRAAPSATTAPRCPRARSPARSRTPPRCAGSLPTLPASCSRSSTTLGASRLARCPDPARRRRSRSAPAMSSVLRSAHQRVGTIATLSARSRQLAQRRRFPGRLADHRLRAGAAAPSTNARHRCSPSSQISAVLAVGVGLPGQLAQPARAAGCRAS